MLEAHRPDGRFFYWLGLILVVGWSLIHTSPAVAADDAPATTHLSDTVYRADGNPASGTVLISWPAFTTAESVANREIVDENKFKDGLGKIIDGTVQCLNASSWAQAK